MNKRQSDIIKVLYRNGGYMTFAELAEMMNVSVKTVRNDISAIKESLSEKSSVETKPHVGVKLTMDGAEWKSISGKGDCADKEI